MSIVEHEGTGCHVLPTDDAVEVSVTDEALWYVRQLTYEGDEGDSARSVTKAREHATGGSVAEVAVGVWLESCLPAGWSWSWYTADKHSDVLLTTPTGDEVRVDVKARLDQHTHGRDLLVEPRRYSAVEVYDSDVYLQAIVYEHAVRITGWASKADAVAAEWFGKAKSHDTKLISSSDLRSLSELFESF